MVRIGLMASEEMSFENVDDDDGQRMPAYIISSSVLKSLRITLSLQIFEFSFY